MLATHPSLASLEIVECQDRTIELTSLCRGVLFNVLHDGTSAVDNITETSAMFPSLPGPVDNDPLPAQSNHPSD